MVKAIIVRFQISYRIKVPTDSILERAHRTSMHIWECQLSIDQARGAESEFIRNIGNRVIATKIL